MINLGDHTLAQALHDKICLLYMKLEAGGSAAQRVAIADKKYGAELPERNQREELYKMLVDALYNYEQVTGREDHPMNKYLLGIVV